MQKSANYHCQQGFSLIEVLIALAIAVMAISIALPSLSDSLFRQADAKDKIAAIWLAHSKMEQITSLPHGKEQNGQINQLYWRYAKEKQQDEYGLQTLTVEIFNEQGQAPVAYMKNKLAKNRP